jgi:hypothetical protein
MIKIGFYFPNEQLSILIETLLGLPHDLRPQFFSYGEKIRNKKDLVDDSERFEPFLKKALSGFFLFSQKLLFQFLIAENVDIQFFIEGVSREDAKLLVKQLSKCLPAFGYVSNIDERRHRNTLAKQASYGHQTAGVGIDWRRYIPGIYWITVIPNTLIELHHVPFDKLKAAAEGCEESIPGVWMLRFFDDPDKWQEHAERLDRLCAETPGIFSVSRVRPAFEAATTFLETEDVLYSWR